MFYSVETKRLLIWKCQRHYLIITRIITSKWDNFSKSDKNLSTFVSTLANFWKFFVRNTSSALYHFSYFSRIDYFKSWFYFSCSCPKFNFFKSTSKPHLLRCKIDKMIKTLPRNNHKNGLTFLSRCEEIESIV